MPDAQELAGWIAGLADPNAERRKTAVAHFLQAGPRAKAAVPELIQLLTAKAPHPQPDLIVDVLGGIGPAAKSAYPDLKRLLHEERESATALEAALTLLDIDSSEPADTVPTLIWGALKQSPTRLTVVEARQDGIRAARALGKLGPAAQGAIPELVKHFDGKFPGPYGEDEFDAVRQLAVVEAAVMIDADQAEKAIPVLLKAMPQGDLLKSEAVAALTRIGPAAKAAMPELLKRFEAEGAKPNGTFHLELALAMVAIDSENAQPALKWIRDRLARRDDVNFELIQRIPALGRRAKPLLPELLVMLAPRGSLARPGSIIEALAAIGPEANAALPKLQEIEAKHPHEKLRKLATEAIRKLQAR